MQGEYYRSGQHDQQHDSRFQPLPASHTPAYPPWVQPLPRPPQIPLAPAEYHTPPPVHYDPAHAGPSRSRGRDYLLSLHTDMSNLALDQLVPSRQPWPRPSADKPLPRLPPAPPLPSRTYNPNDVPRYTHSNHHVISQPQSMGGSAGSTAAQQYQTSTPPRRHPTSNQSPKPPSVIATEKPGSRPTPPESFRPSADLTSPARLYPPRSEPRLARPHSDPIVPTTPTRKSKKHGESHSPIIVIDDSDADTTCSGDVPIYVTSRSPARRKRASSERPPPVSGQSGRLFKASPRVSGTPSKSSGAVRCAGYTRKGAPCQRLVKAEAPYLSMIDPGTDLEDRVVARYCKDHAGMICNAKGFYWRSRKEDAGVWIDFDGEPRSEVPDRTCGLLPS
jgi:hypothetical protein